MIFDLPQFEIVSSPSFRTRRPRCTCAPTTRAWIHTEAFAHLPPDTPLFRKNDLGNGRHGEDKPEEEGGREGGRVVGGENEMVEDEGEGEVEDVRRSTDKVVEVDDAGGKDVSAS
jgi:hypothetical protein